MASAFVQLFWGRDSALGATSSRSPIRWEDISKDRDSQPLASFFPAVVFFFLKELFFFKCFRIHIKFASGKGNHSP